MPEINLPPVVDGVTQPPLALRHAAAIDFSEHADLLADLFPETTAVRQATAPHEHQWFVTCRKDCHGTTVLDCACGARKRTRGGVDGGDVVIDPPAGPIGDVLFDYSTIKG